MKVIIIGAGPAGLAAAAELHRRGIDAVVLERGNGVGESWRHRYDRLHLHTVRTHSALPGLAIPRSYGRFVARRDVVAYLEQYASTEHVDVRLHANVDRLSRLPEESGGCDRWLVRLESGADLVANAVVVATGRAGVPVIPRWPGVETFTGNLLHSNDYFNATPFHGQRVLVVGAGNSGAEIAVDLAESGADAVDLSIRTPPHIVRREVGPIWSAQQNGILLGWLPDPVIDFAARIAERLTVPDLSGYGLPRPTVGLATRLTADQTVPLQDVGLIDAVRSRAVTIKPALASLDATGAMFAGGTYCSYDAVVAATGYRTGLERLLPMQPDLLDPHGFPYVHGGRPAAPGLYFLGFSVTLGGALRDLSKEARRVARSIQRTMGLADKAGRSTTDDPHPWL